MIQIYEKTKRMTDLLENWQPSDHLEISISGDSPSKFRFSFQGGSEQNAIMLTAIASLLGECDLESIENLSLRELDYFLRDHNTQSVFSDLIKAEMIFLEAKSIIFRQIALNLWELSDKSNHKLTTRFLAYNAALKWFLASEKQSLQSGELVDIDNGLVIVKLREELDNSRNWLEEISESMAKLFQDDEINVIPE